MFHLTVAIGRFFEILLFDIAKSIAGLVALGLIVVAGCIGGVVGLRRLGRRRLVPPRNGEGDHPQGGGGAQEG